MAEGIESGPRQLGEVMSEVVERTARAALAHWLGQAEAATNDIDRQRAIEQVIAFRDHLGLTWPQIVGSAAA